VEPVAPRRAPPRRVVVTRKPVSRANALRRLLEQNLLPMSSALLLVGVTGWGLALYSEFRASGLIGAGATPGSTYAETLFTDSAAAKGDPFALSTYAPAAPRPQGASVRFAAPCPAAPAPQSPRRCSGRAGFEHQRARLELFRTETH